MIITARRAIEALRAGVPNRHAVHYLGSNQTKIAARFAKDLERLPVDFRSGDHTPGFFVEGSFGSGKSHLLKWLELKALQSGFACSTVVLSKETPLSHPALVFRSAIESLVLPDRQFGGLEEIALKLDHRSDSYRAFYASLNTEPTLLAPIFGATLFLHENSRGADQELCEHVVEFWGGGKLGIVDIKQALKKQGASVIGVRQLPISELTRQRFRFVSELIFAAGYSGWVLLMDEGELIARLPRKARAKAYGNLYWLIVGSGCAVPGLLCVTTFTDEFTGNIDQKQDRLTIPASWKSSDPALCTAAIAGLDLLEHSSGLWEKIRPETVQSLSAIGELLSRLYAEAYDVPLDSMLSDGIDTGLINTRLFVRKLVTKWDLQRFDADYVPHIEVTQEHPDLSESIDLRTADESELE